MGFKQGQRLVKHIIAKTSGNSEPVCTGKAEVDILAIDANPFIYWVNETIIPAERTGPEIVKKIVAGFVRAVTDFVAAVKPRIVILVLDGVPPTAKMYDQKRRRMSPSDSDVVVDGVCVFSTSLICPNSEILAAIDSEMSGKSFPDAHYTIYSGPGVPGEGEHKIFPIIHSLCAHGISAIEPSLVTASGADASSPSAATRWRPKTIEVIANDNDLFLIGAFFLSTFKEDVPELLLYSDFETTKRGEERNLSPKSPDDLKFFKVNLLLNSIVDPEGPFAPAGKTAFERCAHFVHLMCLVGNDFLPSMSEYEVTHFVQIIMSASRATGPHLAEMKGDLVVDSEQSTSFSGAAGYDPFASMTSPAAPSAEKIVAMGGPRELAVTIVSDFTVLAHVLERIAVEMNNRGQTMAEAQDKLAKIRSYNGVEDKLSNRVAYAAAATYLRTMDAVLSYYASTATVAPKSVLTYSILTMPEEPYLFGVAPPTIIYLATAAQYLAVLQQGRGKEYPKYSSALSTYNMSGIDFAAAPTPGRFCEIGFHSAFVYPSRITRANVLQSAFAFNTEALRGLNPTLQTEDTNPVLIPFYLFRVLREMYGTHCSGMQRYSLTTEIKRHKRSVQTERITNYTSDSLNNV